jgi:hypothetical protein
MARDTHPAPSVIMRLEMQLDDSETIIPCYCYKKYIRV